MNTTDSLYDTDFYGWTQFQAKILREGKFQNLDIENLIEEIESMGKSEQRELESRLEILLMHLLKWRYQPERRSVSWELTIKTQRNQINRHLKKNPSLQSKIDEAQADAYEDATFSAAQETQLHIKAFPSQCPWTFAEIMDADFWPEAPQSLSTPPLLN